MKKANRSIKFASIVSLSCVAALFVLIQYHYSFDPYSYVDPTVKSVESRSVWLWRRNVYFYTFCAAFVSLTISLGLLILSWITGRVSAAKLK